MNSKTSNNKLDDIKNQIIEFLNKKSVNTNKSDKEIIDSLVLQAYIVGFDDGKGL